MLSSTDVCEVSGECEELLVNLLSSASGSVEVFSVEEGS